VYISIDVGGTNMRAALVDLDDGARILNLESHPVPQNYSRGVEELSRLIQNLSTGQNIQGIGACFPGIIDKNGMITTANNLPDWGMKPIEDTLHDRFGVPVKLVHDVQGAAIGEALFGAAKNSGRFIFFIWGTGIGAADIKKIDEKHYFMFSFENGHHIMDWDGKLCNCGQRGCPEAYLGGDMLGEYFGQDMKTVADDDLRWDFVVQKAAQVVINTLIFHPVDLFVFGGGVITRRPFLLERIQPVMKEHLKIFPPPKMAVAELGDRAALYGCAGLFLIDLIS
jgi:predicted NBD/HSP70 family sugar kinase